MARTSVAREVRFGGYLEDYETGDTFTHWPGKTITQSEDHLFCLLTMAVSSAARRRPLRRDGDGRRPQRRRRLVRVRLAPRDERAGRLRTGDRQPRRRRLRHVAPLYHGDTLYGESTVVEARPSASRPGTGVLTVQTTGLNQHREVVCTFRRSVLLPMRPTGLTDASE